MSLGMLVIDWNKCHQPSQGWRNIGLNLKSFWMTRHKPCFQKKKNPERPWYRYSHFPWKKENDLDDYETQRATRGHKNQPQHVKIYAAITLCAPSSLAMDATTRSNKHNSNTIIVDTFGLFRIEGHTWTSRYNQDLPCIIVTWHRLA